MVWKLFGIYSTRRMLIATYEINKIVNSNNRVQSTYLHLARFSVKVLGTLDS